MYIIKSKTINGIKLSEDLKSVNLDFTIFYNIDGESKLPNGSIGDTITLSLETGERNTMVSEMETKIIEWFNLKFNV